jgi:hypothetical protein
MERHYAIVGFIFSDGCYYLQHSTDRIVSLVNLANSGVRWGDIILGNGTDI